MTPTDRAELTRAIRVLHRAVDAAGGAPSGRTAGDLLDRFGGHLPVDVGTLRYLYVEAFDWLAALVLEPQRCQICRAELERADIYAPTVCRRCEPVLSLAGAAIPAEHDAIAR
jgi:hypothetical protein